MKKKLFDRRENQKKNIENQKILDELNKKQNKKNKD